MGGGTSEWGLSISQSGPGTVEALPGAAFGVLDARGGVAGAGAAAGAVALPGAGHAVAQEAVAGGLPEVIVAARGGAVLRTAAGGAAERATEVLPAGVPREVPLGASRAPRRGAVDEAAVADVVTAPVVPEKVAIGVVAAVPATPVDADAAAVVGGKAGSPPHRPLRAVPFWVRVH